jgi:hypothetical protein
MASVSQSSSTLIDPRSHRFAAACSVLILATAYVADAPVLVLLVTFAAFAGAALGSRYALLARPWPLVQRVFRLRSARELEPEFGPRFAQALAGAMLAFADVMFYFGAVPLAWLVVASLAGLQVFLVATGTCVGCRLYGLRWFLPSLFDRLVGKQTPSYGETFR